MATEYRIHLMLIYDSTCTEFKQSWSSVYSSGLFLRVKDAVKNFHSTNKNVNPKLTQSQTTKHCPSSRNNVTRAIINKLDDWDIRGAYMIFWVRSL